jgi:hypothetical protein
MSPRIIIKKLACLLGLSIFLNFSCGLNRDKSFYFFNIGESSLLQGTVPSLILSTQNVVITEGKSNSYTLVLNQGIQADLVVSFHCSQSYIQCPGDIQFNVNNWNIPQIVILSYEKDNTKTGMRTMNIEHKFNYQGSNIMGDSIQLRILDIDSASIIYNPSLVNPFVREGTVSYTYSIALTSVPSSDVQVVLHYIKDQKLNLNENSTGTYTFTFNSVNYNIPQNVTLSSPFNTGLGNRNVTINSNVTSNDLNYDGFYMDPVNVVVEGNSGGAVGWGSFQSGILNSGFSNSTVNLGTTVNPSKAYVYCSFEYSVSGPNHVGTCQLNETGTQVRVQTGGGTGAKVNWYLVELQTGLKVERGSTLFSTSESLKTVTLNQSFINGSSFVLLYTRTNNTSVTNDAERLVKGKLLNHNTLELSRNKSDTAGMNVTVEWQVVELAGAKVVSGSLNLNQTEAIGNSSLGDSFNLSKSFVHFNTSADSLINGIESNYYIRGRFSSPSTLSFSREGTSGTVYINYFAIELVDASTVQSGVNVPVGNTENNIIVNLTNPVVAARSMVVFSNSTQGLDDSYQDSGTFSVLFDPTPIATQISFTRFVHESHSCSLDWFVIEFPP